MNYIRSFTVSILFALAACAMPMHAIFESFAIWIVDTPHGPVEVLVLGEYHYCYTMDATDIPHTSQFKKSIQSWANGHRKTMVLLEQNEHTFEHIKTNKEVETIVRNVVNPHIKYQGDHQGMLFEIAAFLKEIQSENVTYSWCDPRNHVGEFCARYEDMCKGKVHLCENCNPETVGDYLNEVDSCLALVKDYKDTLPESKINYEVLTRYERDLNINKARAKLAFYSVAKAKDTTPYMKAMHALHTTHEGDFLNVTHPLYFGKELLCLVADAGFVVELMKHLRQYDRIVFAGGTAHAVEINKYLQTLACNGMAQCKGVFGRELMQPIDFGKKDLNPIKSSSMNHLFDISCTDHCSYCNKVTAKEKPLKRCASCKIAKYCSRDCQLLDWKDKHKPICARLIEGRQKAEKLKLIWKE